jgi:hypothetical protein
MSVTLETTLGHDPNISRYESAFIRGDARHAADRLVTRGTA